MKIIYSGFDVIVVQYSQTEKVYPQIKRIGLLEGLQFDFSQLPDEPLTVETLEIFQKTKAPGGDVLVTYVL